MKSNVVNKTKDINAKISIEITGEDMPTKNDKKRERWSTIVVWSLIVWCTTLGIALFMDLNIYLFVISGLSFAVFLVSLCESGDSAPEDPGYNNIPWGFWL